MKRIGRIRRILASWLMLILCIGELGENVLRVSAGGDGTEVSEESVPASGEEKDAATDDAAVTGPETGAMETGKPETAAPETESGDVPAPEGAGRDGRGGSAVKSAENSLLGTAGMAKPRLPMYASDPWHGSFVWYGRYDGTPVKYRVLDPHSSDFGGSDGYTMLLMSNKVLYDAPFDPDFEEWEMSSIRFGLNGDDFLDHDVFSAPERAAVKASYKKAAAGNDGRGGSLLSFAKLNGDKIFLPDAKEVTRSSYGFTDRDVKSGQRAMSSKDPAHAGWWLRSSCSNHHCSGSVKKDGELYNQFADSGRGVCPAFNIDLNQVLFSTAVNGKKGETDTAYKLTLTLDNIRTEISVGQKVSVLGNKVSIPYTLNYDDSNPVKPDAVSVLILDKALPKDLSDQNGARILYYYRLSLDGRYSKNGTGSFTLPSSLDVKDWDKSYKVYIFAEEINDDQHTDYAGSARLISAGELNIVESVTVTFNANGHGTAPAPQTIEKGKKLTKPKDPTADGYRFKGWHVGVNERAKAFDFNTPVTEDMTLYAHWSSESVTVTFDPKGGSAVAPQTIRTGSCATEPEAPVREGYFFGGWHVDEGCTDGSVFDFGTPVKANITLYAKWKTLHSVSFDANGGSGSMESLQVADGEYLTFPDCEFAPANAEKAFTRWFVDGYYHYPGSRLKVTKDLTVQAQWKDLLFESVYFYDKYGDGNSVEVRVKHAEKVDPPSPAPSHEGHTFLGWYTRSFDDNSARAEDLYDFQKAVYGTLRLYACYTDDTTYHIEVYSNPGGLVTVDKEFVSMNEIVTLTVTTEEAFELYFLSGVVVYDDYHSGYKFKNIYPEDLTDGKFTYEFPDLSKAPEYAKKVHIEGIFKVKEDHEHSWEYHKGNPPACDEIGTYGYAECTDCHHRYVWDEEKNVFHYDITELEDPFVTLNGYHGRVKGGVVHEAQEPTCSVSGNTWYVYCNDCGAYILDGNYQAIGTYEDVIIPIDVNAHDWDPATVSYVWADDMKTVSASCICRNDSAHVLTEEVSVNAVYSKAATCEEDGIASFTSEAFANPLFSAQSKTDVPVPKTGHDWEGAVYEWSDDLRSVTASMVCKNDPSHRISETASCSIEEMDTYRRYTASFADDRFEEQQREIAELHFDTNGKSALDVPETLYVDLGEKAARPDKDPSAEGLRFAGWHNEAECITKFDFDAPVRRNAVIYARWIDKDAVLHSVSFNMCGHGEPVAPQEVVSGNRAVKPADPTDAEYVFGGWFADASYAKTFDFETPVTSDLIVYAKWMKDPSDVSGTHSPLDPVPLIDASTTELFLVKGQKFTIGEGWYIDSKDKKSKRTVSISKKGLFKAKKEGEAVIHFGDRSITVHVSKPSVKKSLTLTVVSANESVSAKIDLTNPAGLPVYWHSAAPDVATVEQDGTVKAVGKGRAKITAYINGSAYNCTVTVKEKTAAAERTLHLPVGAHKNLSLTGVKKPVWSSASDDIARMDKNKVTAKSSGTTTLTASANGAAWHVSLFAEDLALKTASDADAAKLAAAKGKNKYTLTLNAGDEPELAFGYVKQAVVFKSSKPDIAFIDENGKVSARRAGKAKFTAKVDGKTITVTVNVNGK
ncbi:MAG: InlB B-repeat-containing protein [Lachnospiraceae bacterium]|nr:InlB B-repeat-containing protein [Lachnospiraceae bacterium]